MIREGWMKMSNAKESANRKAVRVRTAGIALQYMLAAAVTLIVIFPIYWMIISSLKTSEELLRPVPSLWPAQFRWENYGNALKMAPFGKYFFNTIVMTAGIMTFQVIIGSFAAYGFAVEADVVGFDAAIVVDDIVRMLIVPTMGGSVLMAHDTEGLKVV